MPNFAFTAGFEPAGGQPQAIRKLGEGIERGLKHQTLMGVTGSGKTMVVAQMIQEIQRPTLVMSPNKTLAAQLCSEFRSFFPQNAVEYFVSYYDYYQPEAYIPRSDTYIEKDSSRNDEIDRLRQSATRALLTRRDVIVVASVSCIYGVGSPEDYLGESVEIHAGEGFRRDIFLRKLTNLQYQRNDVDFGRSRFRVRGDTVDVQPSYDQIATRVQFNGDEVERIVQLDPLTGELIGDLEVFQVFPATHYVTPRQKLLRALDAIGEELDERVAWFESQGKLLEAQRLRQRTLFDLEMMRETGSCAGIENYSRHLTGRRAGQEPYTLMDFLPADTLVVVDESHVGVPQIGGMYGGDRSRKIPLVDYGFRLPSALDNRPLTFAEWERKVQQVVYVTATPGPYEEPRSQIQTTGRAARNVEGHVIMYADSVSGSMQRAIDETDRRRNIQIAYNEEHGITPATIVKAVYNLEKHQEKAVEETIATLASGLPPDEIERLIKDLERQMKKAARDLQFERAAELRDRLVALRRDAMEYRGSLTPAAAAESGTWRKPKTSRMRARVHG